MVCNRLAIGLARAVNAYHLSFFLSLCLSLSLSHSLSLTLSLSLPTASVVVRLVYLGHRIDARVRAVLQVEKSEIELRETRAQRGHGADLKEAAVEFECAEVRQSAREEGGRGFVIPRERERERERWK